MLERVRRKGNSPTLLAGHKLVQSLWKTILRFLKKLKIEPPYDPTIPLLGTYSEKTKTLFQKDTSTPKFTAVLLTIHNSQDLEATYVSIHRWMDKEDVIYTQNGISLSRKKEWSNAFAATWMKLEIIVLSEVSQMEKDKYYMILTNMWDLKKMIQWTYLWNRNRLTDVENKLIMFTKGVVLVAPSCLTLLRPHGL